MEILLIGDPHFKTTNAFEIDQFIEEIYKLVRKKKYDKIVLLGDILDTHEKINLRILCKANNFIIKLSQYATVYVLIGNHDRINNNVYLTDEHPFTALKNKKNIIVVDKVVCDDFIYVPYVPTGRFNEAIGDIDLKKYEIIFAHQEFRGSIFKDQGDIAPDIKIYSGHIHNYRVMKKITYLGTPFQHSFYDNEDKFVMELNININKKIDITEKKIYLDIIKKRVQYLSMEDLIDYKVDEKYITQLVIDNDRKFLNNKNLQKILNHPGIRYKIKYLKEDIKMIEKKEDISFRTLLEERLEEENESIRKLYLKLSE